MLGTVTRAGKALELFTPERPTWGATAVARELAIAKSQAHELLTSLTEIGLLRRVPGGRYRLGWRMLALGRNGLRCEFPDEALRAMRAFAMHYREPVQLVALDRDRLAVVAQYSTRSATDELLPATLDPHMATCALARVLLADLPGDAAEEILGASASPVLLSDLARVRADRLAFDDGGTHPELCAVAVPIVDGDGHTLAAFGVWTTAARWRQSGDELTRATIGVGQRVRAIIRGAAQVAA
jgi:DNA-binding IclR family transcriptional regulator